jgi:rfaE bifunctional protein kinase chain/domain
MDLLHILKQLPKQRILVIGDLVLDRYIWGRVSRISPEAPVPVVDVTGDSFMLGGAANVGSNIVALEGQATVMGVVGSDLAARTMEELMTEQGIRFVAVEDKRPTTVKTRVIAHNQQVVRFDQENRDYLGGKTLKTLLANVTDAVKSHDAVIISDYKKGVVNAQLIKTVLQAAGRKKFVAVDPKVGHFHLYKGASLITPNLMEASQGAAMEIKDEKTLIKAGKKLMKGLQLGSALITRGEHGMSLFRNGEVVHIPTMALKVFDVTGAGDTVIATYALAKAAGATSEEAAVLSNHAAGIVVGEVGAAQATQDKIKKSIKTMEFDIRRERI